MAGRQIVMMEISGKTRERPLNDVIVAVFFPLTPFFVDIHETNEQGDGGHENQWPHARTWRRRAGRDVRVRR